MQRLSGKWMGALDGWAGNVLPAKDTEVQFAAKQIAKCLCAKMCVKNHQRPTQIYLIKIILQLNCRLQ